MGLDPNMVQARFEALFVCLSRPVSFWCLWWPQSERTAKATVSEMAKQAIGVDDELFLDSALMDSGMVARQT